MGFCDYINEPPDFIHAGIFLFTEVSTQFSRKTLHREVMISSLVR
jgi:hypothetical protein